jgi:hypothetical protein
MLIVLPVNQIQFVHHASLILIILNKIINAFKNVLNFITLLNHQMDLYRAIDANFLATIVLHKLIVFHATTHFYIMVHVYLFAQLVIMLMLHR